MLVDDFKIDVVEVVKAFKIPESKRPPLALIRTWKRGQLKGWPCPGLVCEATSARGTLMPWELIDVVL